MAFIVNKIERRNQLKIQNVSIKHKCSHQFISQGDDFDEEEADRMRQIEFLKCKEEWDHVLSKSQNNNKQQQLLVESSLNKPSLQSSITPSDHSSSSEITKTSKNSFKQTSISDSQKKQHCDEQPHKVRNDQV